MPSQKKRVQRRVPKILYLIAFLSALHVGIPFYINSTFLVSLLQEQYVGLVYTAGALLSIFSIIALPYALRRFGNFNVVSTVIFLEVAAITAFTIAPSVSTTIFSFTAYLALQRLIFISYDIFIEDSSRNAKTGEIRGMYYTALNLGILLSPIIAGSILTNGDFWKVYLTSGVLTIPVYALLVYQYRRFKDPQYRTPSFFKSARGLFIRSDLRNIFVCGFLLSTFFSWMVIYTPIYLHGHLGIAWSDIGIILTIMLIPFVILEIPLGLIADSKIGEKELLIAGFAITGVSTLFIPMITSVSILAWAALLFTTRVGASTIEIMSETYFFKKISSREAHFLSIYRLAKPAGYIIGPLAATASLSYLDLRLTFLVLGTIMLTGIFFASRIHDTN